MEQQTRERNALWTLQKIIENRFLRILGAIVKYNSISTSTLLTLGRIFILWKEH